MRAGGGERLQVGLDAGAAAAVGGGDRQCSRNQQPPFAGIPGSGSTGVISAPRGAPRWPEASIGGVSVDVLRWEGLLEGEELAYLGTEPEREARHAAAARRARPARPRRRSACRALYAHQREAWDAAARGEHVLRHDRHRVGQDARVQPAGARRARARAEEPRALPLPDEGARAGPVPHARRRYRSPRLQPAIYDGDTPTEQRRQIRKWANVILTNPDMVHVGAAAEPRPLGRRAREPPLRRRRRGARLPRRLRLARRERPAPAAAARAHLRRRAAVPARVGDDLEPRRARRRAARRAA